MRPTSGHITWVIFEGGQIYVLQVLLVRNHFYAQRLGILLCFSLGLGYDIWFWWRESDCLSLASNMIGYTYHKYTAYTGFRQVEMRKIYNASLQVYISKVGCWKHQWKTLTSTMHVQQMGELTYLIPIPLVHYIFTIYIKSFRFPHICKLCICK